MLHAIPSLFAWFRDSWGLYLILHDWVRLLSQSWPTWFLRISSTWLFPPMSCPTLDPSCRLLSFAIIFEVKALQSSQSELCMARGSLLLPSVSGLLVQGQKSEPSPEPAIVAPLSHKDPSQGQKDKNSLMSPYTGWVWSWCAGAGLLNKGFSSRSHPKPARLQKEGKADPWACSISQLL